MDNKRKVLLIATGGTIASTQSENGLKPGISSDEILKFIPEVTEYAVVDAISVCAVDSTNMKPEIWKKIVATIKENYFNYDGIVIAHGTDTMAYTAAALSYLIQNSDKPIVLTGSQKPIELENTDGRTNLMDAIIYAADPKSQGVTIVFNGKVIAGTRAKKVRSKSYNAFDSIDFPFLAQIQGNQIMRYIPMIPYEEPVRFYESLDEKIYLMKLIPGMNVYALEEIFQYYDAIIVESFGVGGIPDSISDSFYEFHEKYPETIIIMCTQVAHEGSDMTVYEVGQKIKEDCHFLESYDMTLESVIAKTMWMLGNYEVTSDNEEDIFYKHINYDLVFGKNRQAN
ncbi:MAG: asparaginase [Lachnospiraceae bacterium]|nr:asparaginase [Lachnospiraceae bacterium]